MHQPVVIKVFIGLIAFCAVSGFCSMLVMGQSRKPVLHVDQLTLVAMNQPLDAAGQRRGHAAQLEAIKIMRDRPWNHKPYMRAAHAHHVLRNLAAARAEYEKALELLRSPQKIKSGIPRRLSEFELDRGLARHRIDLIDR